MAHLFLRLKSLLVGSFAAPLFIFSSVHCANAGIIISISEVGNDVEAEFLGTFNVELLTVPRAENSISAGLQPGRPGASAGGGTAQRFDLDLDSSDGDFGTAGTFVFFPADNRSGDPFSFSALSSAPTVFLPVGYAGEELSGSFAFLDTDFAALSLTPGAYEYIFSAPQVDDVAAPGQIPTDFIRVDIGPQGDSHAVPVPATLALLGLGLLSLRLRRKG